jgi:cation:H+ antiporter
MILSALLMLIGLAVLVGGAEALVRGASALARRLGVPTIVIGLTVVAFGTSTPELAINIAAAIEGNTGISFGNVVGSNIANIGLILAVAALVRPLDVHPSIITREIPMLLLGTAAAVAMAFDQALGAGPDLFARGDGIVLLLLFGVFLYYTLLTALKKPGDAYVEDLKDDVARQRPQPIWASLILTAAGLVAVVAGGKLSVDSAVMLARKAGISDAVIGLTIIAIGTGLPELVTSIVAARRGASDLAVGNVVGSNIYNLLFVLGATATIRPITLPSGGHADLLIMAALTAALLPLASYRKLQIGRRGGALLLACYIAFIVWRVAI